MKVVEKKKKKFHYIIEAPKNFVNGLVNNNLY